MAFNIGSLSAAQQIQLIYTAYFGRAAEPGGFNFWEPVLSEGVQSLSEIADGFFNQPETREVYNLDPGVTSTTELPSTFLFLKDVYENLFGRLPEPGGVSFWADVLDSGAFTIGEVILKIAEGAQGDDIDALNNRIEAGLHWKDSAETAGVKDVNPEPSFDNDPTNNDPNYDAAVAALEGVNNDDTTVDDSKDATNSYFFNDAPEAADDADNVAEDGTVTIDVLDNDTDIDGDAVTIDSATDGTFGTTTVNPDGTITYTPDSNENGTDSFTYTITDGNGESDTATVTVNVTAVDDAPVAQDESESATEDTSITGQLVASDVDNENDDITYSVNGPAPAGLTSRACGPDR